MSAEYDVRQSSCL